LNSVWQRHVLAPSGYLELGMFDDAALVLEEIEPEDKTRSEVLAARVGIYLAAKKWDMAAAVASGADCHFAFRTDDFDGGLATLTVNGFREEAAEDDPMRVMVRRDGPAGFPQLFILDPDRNIIEINGAP
jgi:hypothetical protein